MRGVPDRFLQRRDVLVGTSNAFIILCAIADIIQLGHAPLKAMSSISLSSAFVDEEYVTHLHSPDRSRITAVDGPA